MTTAFPDLKGYQQIDSIRTLLLSHSLSPGTCITDLAVLCVDSIPAGLGFDAYAVYLLDATSVLRCEASRVPNGCPTLGKSVGEKEWQRLLPEWSPVSVAKPLLFQDCLPSDDAVASRWGECLGTIRTYLRLPLNASRSTIGFLEAVSTEIPDGLKIHEVVEISRSLATAIVTWRSRSEGYTLSDVIRSFSGTPNFPNLSQDQTKEVFEEALQRALNRLQRWRAAVLYIAAPDRAYQRVLAKAAQKDLSWDGWQDVDLKHGDYLAGRAFALDAPQYVEDTMLDRNLFANFDWISKAGIRACASYPLKSQQATIGTLTVYAGYNYSFTKLDESFFRGLGEIFAIALQALEAYRGEKEANRNLAVLQQELERQKIQGARAASLHHFVDKLHGVKNSWRLVLNDLENVAKETSGRTAVHLKRAIQIAQHEYSSLTGAQILDLRGSTPIDIVQIVRDIVRANEPTLRGEGISVRSVMGKLPVIMMPDAEFREIINNLLANSIRAVREAHRDKGDIVISGDCDTDRDELAIKVSDNGVGIRRDDLPRLFERGFTNYASTGGTGLGLFLVRDIVKRWGGDVEVTSTFGVGTTFVVNLPLSWVTT